jgi:hypothetical protein
MREILVGLRADQERELNRLAKQSGSSRAALIRDAIDHLLAGKRRRAGEQAFGLWGNRDQDGLAYQREMRAEW